MQFVGRPSVFGVMPLPGMIPSFDRCNSGPCGGQPMRGLLQELFGNGTGYQGGRGWDHPGCLDQTGRRHCRSHCYGHCNPDTILEQFIIQDIIEDAHRPHPRHSRHGCKSKGKHEGKDSEAGKSNATETTGNEGNSSDQMEVSSQPDLNNTVSSQSEPWSVEVDMSGCDEVRAWTENGQIVVKGHSTKSHGFMAVQRVMTLPRHVRGETLTATLGREGTLTLREAQANSNKDNQVMDIPVQKEQNLQSVQAEQNENGNLVDQTTLHPDVNVNNSDISEEKEAVTDKHIDQ